MINHRALKFIVLKLIKRINRTHIDTGTKHWQNGNLLPWNFFGRYFCVEVRLVCSIEPLENLFECFHFQPFSLSMCSLFFGWLAVFSLLLICLFAGQIIKFLYTGVRPSKWNESTNTRANVDPTDSLSRILNGWMRVMDADNEMPFISFYQIILNLISFLVADGFCASHLLAHTIKSGQQKPIPREMDEEKRKIFRQVFAWKRIGMHLS